MAVGTCRDELSFEHIVAQAFGSVWHQRANLRPGLITLTALLLDVVRSHGIDHARQAGRRRARARPDPPDRAGSRSRT